MKRKLPNCAYCGKPLRRAFPRFTVEFPAPGTPMVGWHGGECETRDSEVIDVAFGCMDGNKGPPPKDWMPWAAAEILRRGRKRVTAGPAFWRLVAALKPAKNSLIECLRVTY